MHRKLYSILFEFWNTHQNAHESLQEWEVGIKQAGSLCAYDALNDEMCRDKFVFGLHDGTMRTELLKTHLKTDGTPKTMQDVVAEAKALESAQKANKLISDTEKGIEEQVNWISHKQMKLKWEPGTCHWCGDRRRPHPWKTCPANGKTTLQGCAWRKALPNSLNKTARGNRNPRGRPQSISRGQQEHHLHTTEDHPADYFSDDYLEEQCYSLETQQIHSVHTPPSRGKYFVHLPMSATGNKFQPVKFQIDTAATCNTMSDDTLFTLMPSMKITKSPYLLYCTLMVTHNHSDHWVRLTSYAKETRNLKPFPSRYSRSTS